MKPNDPADGEENPRQIHPWDLLADAITAAHSRHTSTIWPDSNKRDLAAVPFLYHFLDCLRLALPDGPPICLAALGSDTALSTRTGGLIPRASQVHEFKLSYKDVEVVIDGDVAGATESRDRLRMFLSRVDSVAAGHAPSDTTHVSTSLAGTLRAIIAQSSRRVPQHEVPTPEVTHDDQRDVSGQLLAEIVRRTQEHICEIMTPSDLSYDIILQSWPESSPSYHLLPFALSGDGRVESTGEPVDLCQDLSRSGWRDTVDRTFRTGFLQIAEIGSSAGERLLCVPCHLGGVPWIVVCQRMAGADCGAWRAYTTYRDLIPRLNDAVRLAGCRSLFSEMRRLFFEASPRMRGQPELLVETIEAKWSLLTRVFPVPCPRLRLAPADSAERARIRFGGHDWCVTVAEDANPFFPISLATQVSGANLWSQFAREDLQRLFVAPTRAELLSTQTRVNAELAQNVYAVGHTLKHRLGRIRGTFGTQWETLKSEPLDRERALDLCQRACLQLGQTGKTTANMDMLADLAQHDGDPTLLDPTKFLACTRYSIGEHLRGIYSEFQAANTHMEVPESDLINLDRLEVCPTIRTQPTPSRLFDTFYDDVFFELLTNAERRSTTLRIRYERLLPSTGDRMSAAPYITFTNPTDEREFDRLSLSKGEWRAWRIDREGPKGGLRQVTNLLRLTDAGELLAKPYVVDGEWFFSIAVSFEGLWRVEERGADG